MVCFSEIVELFIVASILQITAGLQCPSCSHVTITDVPGVVKSAVDSVLGVFQDVKCSQELTGPTKEIKEETCAAPSGKEARCSWYKGTLTMKIPLIGTELPFHVSKRACHYAAAAAVPSNGCHDLNNLNEDSSALEDIIDSLTSVLNVHSFQGQRCLTSETYGDTSSAVSFLYKLPSSLVICNVLVMFVLRYL